jgi:signal transduction histidine kinase
LSADSNRRLANIFKLIVGFSVIAILARGILLKPSDLGDPWLLFWVAAIAAVELMPVPAWRGLRFSLSLPVILAVAILYTPAAAGCVLLVGLFDSRELRREMPVVNSLFNRAEVSLMAVIASTVFHAIASLSSPAWLYVLGGLAAATASYAVNVGLISIVVALQASLSVREVLSGLRVGALPEFLLNYLGLGVIGLAMAVFFQEVGPWSVIAFGAPLVFARQMFFRSMALEEATKELRDRQLVLRALSNRMAEERQDERAQIAAYLHDDLAQTLFQLTLRLEMAKKRLGLQDLDAVSKDLDDISAIKEKTSNMVRSLVRDLHRSPIGRTGLGDAIQSFADEAGRDSPVQLAVDVVEVTLPPPIQLLIYQIAREAVMNAMKHAEPGNIMISLRETKSGVELQVRDDGKGFDTTQPAPEGHFGSVMMRERALVAGGTFTVTSQLAKGTVITAGFPRVWIEEEMEPGLDISGEPDASGGQGKTGAPSSEQINVPAALPRDPGEPNSQSPDLTPSQTPEGPPGAAPDPGKRHPMSA